MRIAAKAIIVTTGVIGLAGSALAADLTGPEIKALLSGKTVYLETTTASASGSAWCRRWERTWSASFNERAPSPRYAGSHRDRRAPTG